MLAQASKQGVLYLLDRDSGKPVYATFEWGGEREYLLATAADVIAVPPTVPVQLDGREDDHRALAVVQGQGRRLDGTGGDLAPDARLGGPPPVQMDPDPGAPVALALGDPLGHHLAQDLPLHVRQLEVLEHDLDQLFEGDVGLVVVDPGLIAGATGTGKSVCINAIATCLGLAIDRLRFFESRSATRWAGADQSEPPAAKHAASMASCHP